ncbi:MAG TPA: class I SAM-dependent methyltransferase [Vicinamibacterales bacterium]|jgi:ubiquinone/menaquinone biosynthesis C-methylase UbiE
MSRPTDYDSVAAGYDVRYRTFDYSEIKQALESFLGDVRADAMLEVGCGTGHWLRELVGHAARVVGVDRSAEMIARAKGAGASLIRASAEQLPFSGAAFDRLLCINALHHFSSRPRFFEESHRVLRNGGGLCTIGLDPHAERDAWWVYDYFPPTLEIDRQRFAAVRTIRGELVKAGFSWAESSEAQVFEHVMPAREAFDAGLVSRSFTSQLTVLTDEELADGMARLRDAMESEKKAGRELMLSSELHLFMTTAWLG